MTQSTICDILGHKIGKVNIQNYVVYPGCINCKKTTREIKEGR